MPTHARVISITAEKVCTCAACGEPILPGEPARFTPPTRETTHPECGSEPHDEEAECYRGSDT
jgi:hypothetical protein